MNGTVVRRGILNAFHSKRLITVKNIMNYPKNLKFPEKDFWMCLRIRERKNMMEIIKKAGGK